VPFFVLGMSLSKIKKVTVYERAGAKNAGPLTWESAPDVLTVEEAAALVRIPRNAAYEAIRLGFLPAHNFGERRIRVAKAVLRQVFGPKPEDRPATAAFSQSGGET
jgi:excisionase family DNA binding protein